MQPADQVEFVRVLNGLAAVKPGAKLTKESIDLYWRSMRDDWSIDQFKTAAAHLMRTVEFMPNPYHFEQLRRAGELTGAEAWTVVLSGRPLEPGSRAARAAAALGGQQAIRHLDIERALPFAQKRFLDAFGEFDEVDPIRERLPMIAGHGAHAAPSGLAHVAAAITTPRPAATLSAPAAEQPRADATPAKTAQEKILALLPLQLSDEDVAKISREPIDVVRQVRRSCESAA